jgi:hypothetical protein
MENETSKAVSRKETLAVLACGIAGFAAMHWFIQHPDAARTLNMRVALAVKKHSHARADYWRAIADHAATKYNEMRNVTI